MKIKYITAAFLGILLLNSPAQMIVNAVDNSSYEQYERAIGLIEKCSLRCTSPERGAIEITAKTQVSGKLSEVGFRNVVIQYSSDGNNWSDEVDLGDLTKNNARYYSLDGRRVQVKGDGFYRVSVVHYADEGGSSGRIQTAVQVSPSVWVTAKPVTTTSTTTTTTTTTTSTTKRITTTVTTTGRKNSSTTAATTPQRRTSSTTKAAANSSVDSSGSTRTAAANGGSGTAAKTTTKPSQTTTTTTAAKESSSPKTGSSSPVMEFTALCSAGAVALFLHSKRPKRS